MKILHINASYKPAYIYGGPTVSVAKLCEEINKVESRKLKVESEGFVSAQPDNDMVGQEKIVVTVYTTLANGREELPYQNGAVKIVDGVEVHYFKRITKDHSHLSPSFLICLWKNIKKFDIVHIHAWWNLISVGAAIICVLNRKKYILSPRGTLSYYSFYNRKSQIKRIFHYLIGKPILKKAIFQVSSEKERKDIEAIVGTHQMYVIPNFVELNVAWEKDAVIDLNHQKAELLFFSRIEEKKGLEFLLNACALLTIPYHLTIAGHGDDNYVLKLKYLIKELGIEESITWLGQVSSADKFKVLSKYDLLVLTSYDENFANVVIESLACGTPVLLSPKVGLADYVLKNEIGWVVAQDALLIARELERIFNHKKEQLMGIREKAKRIVKQDFAEDTLRKSYVQFYQEIIK
jgi:glycosyltransferase involved in cell wall biosynthesis